MPPTSAHLNGSVNLADAETVMREVAARIPAGVRRIPDGETGDRNNWIFFQLQKFLQTPGLAPAYGFDQPGEGYERMPKVGLAEGATAADIAWPDLGYAEAYADSYQTFRRLQADGTIPAGVRFQVQYPTPLASINAWIVEDAQGDLEESYEQALMADLVRLLARIPHDQLAVQWDVAVEIGILEGGLDGAGARPFEAIVDRLARCVARVPDDVPVGLHLCYGDYRHQHFVQPKSLELQVRLVNQLVARATRPVDWFSVTVPQYQRDEAYFAPLADLRVPAQTQLYLGLVPYHPADQEPGTTAAQVELIDTHLARAAAGPRGWGICTECGMGRVERDDLPRLLDLHREILDGSRT